jgi:hypothetical protein
MGTATPGSSDTFTVSVRILVLREANAEGSYPVLHQDLNQHIRCEQERSTALGDRAQAPVVLVTNSNTESCSEHYLCSTTTKERLIVLDFYH